MSFVKMGAGQSKPETNEQVVLSETPIQVWLHLLITSSMFPDLTGIVFNQVLARCCKSPCRRQCWTHTFAGEAVFDRCTY